MWNSSVLWCMGNGDVMSNLISRSCSVKVEPLSISYVIFGSYMYDVMVKYVWYVCIIESWCLLDMICKQIQRYQLLHSSMYVHVLVYHILSSPSHSHSPHTYTYTYTYTQSIYTSLHVFDKLPPFLFGLPLSLPACLLPPLLPHPTSTSISSSPSSPIIIDSFLLKIHLWSPQLIMHAWAVHEASSSWRSHDMPIY